LAPGESRVVVFTPLTRADWQFVGVESHWQLEAGAFRIGLGATTDCRSDNPSDWVLTDNLSGLHGRSVSVSGQGAIEGNSPVTVTVNGPGYGESAYSQNGESMCTDLSLSLTDAYQPVCEEVCAMWTEGVCGVRKAAATCRETCLAQQWQWDYADCLINYFRETSCTSLDQIQCFDPFSSSTVVETVVGAPAGDEQPPSSMLIVLVALATAFGGLVLGFLATYWYFSKYQQLAPTNNKREDLESVHELLLQR
jgi:hypothetical protein